MAIIFDIFEAAGNATDGLKWIINHLNHFPSPDDRKRVVNQRHIVYQMRVIDFAARSGSKETISFLIEQGAELTQSHKGSRGILYYGLLNPNHEVRKYVLQPDILTKIANCASPLQFNLHTACAKGEIENIRKILELPDITLFASDTAGDTAFTYAILGKHSTVWQYLISSKNHDEATQDLKNQIQIELEAHITQLETLAYSDPTAVVFLLREFICFLTNNNENQRQHFNAIEKSYTLLIKLLLDTKEYDKAFEMVDQYKALLKDVGHDASVDIANTLTTINFLMSIDKFARTSGLRIEHHTNISSLYLSVYNHFADKIEDELKNLTPDLMKARVHNHLSSHRLHYQQELGVTDAYLTAFLNKLRNNSPTNFSRLELLAFSRTFNVTLYVVHVTDGNVCNKTIIKRPKPIRTIFLGSMAKENSIIYVPCVTIEGKKASALTEIDRHYVDDFDPQKNTHITKLQRKPLSPLATSTYSHVQVNLAQSTTGQRYTADKQLCQNIRMLACRGDFAGLKTLFQKTTINTDIPYFHLMSGVGSYIRSTGFDFEKDGPILPTLQTLKNNEKYVDAYPVINCAVDMIQLIPEKHRTPQIHQILAECNTALIFIAALFETPNENEIVFKTFTNLLKLSRHEEVRGAPDYPAILLQVFYKILEVYRNTGRLIQYTQCHTLMTTFINKFDQNTQKAVRLGFYSIPMILDGNCQFSSLVHQLKLISNQYKNLTPHQLRQQLVDHIERDPENYAFLARDDKSTKLGAPEPNIKDDFTAYLNNMRRNGTWGDELTLSAFSRTYNMNLVLLYSDNKNPIIRHRANSNGTVYIYYVNNNHYQPLTPVSKAHNKIQKLIEETEIDDYQLPTNPTKCTTTSTNGHQATAPDFFEEFIIVDTNKKAARLNGFGS